MSDPQPRTPLPDFFANPTPDAPPHPDARLLVLAETILAAAEERAECRRAIDIARASMPQHRSATESERRPLIHAYDENALVGRQMGNLAKQARKVPHGLAARIEHAAHIALQPQHHHGEWFLCTKSDAQRAIMASIQEAKRGWKPPQPSAAFLRRANDAIALGDIYRLNMGLSPILRDHKTDPEGEATFEIPQAEQG
jgi:hypothetical protein